MICIDLYVFKAEHTLDDNTSEIVKWGFSGCDITFTNTAMELHSPI